MRKASMVVNGLGIAAFLGVAVGLYLAFVYAPTETTMGDVQRIFYFHLPLAWIAFLAFFVVFVAGIVYLASSRPIWDILALSSAEIGVVFTTLVLATGSIWAKSAWNTWWTWDPRLTTTLVLWLIYVGYMMVRGAVDGADKRARISAIIGIVGFINVPIVFMSIRWWRTMHPLVITRTEIAMATPMVVTLFVCLGAFSLLYAFLMALRTRQGLLQSEIDEIEAQIAGQTTGRQG